MTTPRAALLLNALASGTPGEKAAMAQRLHERHAAALYADPLIRRAMDRLRLRSDRLRAQMATMAMGALCSRCAARPGGGCCSSLMADNTDAIQLLINLLLGVDTRLRETGKENCCFLGEKGCIFLAKPIFCLNYNCSAIVNGNSAEAMHLLSGCAAAVLGQQTLIESLLLDRINPSDLAGVYPENRVR